MSGFSKLNWINVGPKGTFRASGEVKTTPADIDAIFTHLGNTGAGKLAVHFHGGLIKEKSGLEIAEKMWKLFEDDAHPVTFVWETGLLETVKTNLETLNGTKLFQKVVKYALRRAAKKLGGGIGDKGPGEEMSLTEIEQELARIDAFERYDEGARGAAEAMDEADLEAMRDEIQLEVELDLEADEEIDEILEVEPPTTELLDPEFKQEVAEDAQKGILSSAKLAVKIAKIVYRVIKRYIRKRDHGFYPTVVEETLRELYIADLGEWVWDGMKDAAKLMWNENPPTLDDDSHPGTYFLGKLAAQQQAHPGFLVDLVCHSAGSVAVCEMLARAEERFPALRVRNVLFLAPACTSELFHDQIVSRPHRFEAFRMFTMRDDLEAKDRLVPGVYIRSLLYFISGVLEGQWDRPLAGLARHFTGAEPYDDPELQAIHAFVNSPGEGRLVLSETTAAGPGLNSASHHHGDFDDEPVTRASLKAILAA